MGLRKLFGLGMVFWFCTSITSCYYYDGPLRRNNPVTTKPILPPPVPKVVGTPLSRQEYISKAYQDIKEKIPEADVKLVEDSIKILFPNHITYANRSTIPSSDYQTPLNNFAALLKKYRQTNILITGHTDNRGNENLNRNLSVARAIKVRDYLSTCGVGMSRLESWGLGPTIPLDDNSTLEGRARNRRVEFVVLYQDK
jgi:outer membrane protein OmpA-like peptidoglycan-associated protein